MLAVLLLAVTTRQTVTIDLSRGATVGGYRYWSVSDTYLDSKDGDANNGGAFTVLGGPGRTALLKFGDLNRVLGGRKKVTKATLYLQPAAPGAPNLKSVDRVLAPWGHGPSRLLINRPLADPSKKPEAPTWSATWRQRRGGKDGIGWQQGGATSPGDAEPIVDVTAEDLGEQGVAVRGLESAIQKMADRWQDNHGLAFRFNNDFESYSSESQGKGPRLVLEVENLPAAGGPDLSVTMITRTPEYPRYDPAQPNAKKWPSDGEEVTYTAVVKNVGDAPSGNFSGKWFIQERGGSLFEVGKTLAPGESTTITTKRSFKVNHTDHRLDGIAFSITPAGQDANGGNDYLEIQEGAMTVEFVVPKTLATTIGSRVNALGSKSLEDTLQEQVRAINDVLFAESRFSFAPDGALERVRVSAITVGSGPAVPGQADAVVTLDSATNLDRLMAGHERGLSRALGLQLGMADMQMMSIEPASLSGEGGEVKLKEMGKPITRGSVDRFAGMLGGGSTINESAAPGAFGLPHEPFFSPAFENMPLPATNLLSATDVAALNSTLGKRRGFGADILYAQSDTVLLRVQDRSGRMLGNTELSFFQSEDGVIPEAAPAFTLVTNAAGSAFLPDKPVEATTSYSGILPKPNPFGVLDPNGGNGVFLVRASVNGVTEWGWIKAWQLVDAYYRNNRPAAVFMDLRLNAPSAPPDGTANLAANKIVTDSAGGLPAKLSGLIDGSVDAEVDLGAKKDDWVEIDLGRDRTISEIRLLSRSLAFWPKFDVLIYATGQTVTDAVQFSRETDWTWTANNRRDLEAPGVASVAYRGPALRARFIRLVALEGGPAKLAEIKVVGAKVAG